LNLHGRPPELKKQIEKNGAIISTEYASKESIKEFGPDLGMSWAETNCTLSNYKISAKEVGEFYSRNGYNLYYVEIRDTGNGSFAVRNYFSIIK